MSANRVILRWCNSRTSLSLKNSSTTLRTSTQKTPPTTTKWACPTAMEHAVISLGPSLSLQVPLTTMTFPLRWLVRRVSTWTTFLTTTFHRTSKQWSMRIRISRLPRSLRSSQSSLARAYAEITKHHLPPRVSVAERRQMARSSIWPSCMIVSAASGMAESVKRPCKPQASHVSKSTNGSSTDNSRRNPRVRRPGVDPTPSRSHPKSRSLSHPMQITVTLSQYLWLRSSLSDSELFLDTLSNIPHMWSSLHQIISDFVCDIKPVWQTL